MFEEILHQLEELQNKLSDSILNLPDNPRLSRINNNCFILRTTQRENGILLPDFYDYKRVYSFLSIEVKNRIQNPKRCLSFLRTCIEEKRFSSDGISYKLHNDIVSNLKSALGNIL